MAINPNISLSVQPPQRYSPLDSMQKTIAIADMVAQGHERQQTAKLNRLRLDEAEKGLADSRAVEDAFNESFKMNDDGTDVDFDLPKAAAILKSKNMAHLYPKVEQQVNTRRSEFRQRAAEELKWALGQIEGAGMVAENWLARPEAERPAYYLPLQRVIDKMGLKQQLGLPSQYDPATVVPRLEGVVAERNMLKDQASVLEQADKRERAAAELAKIKAETVKLNREGLPLEEQIKKGFDAFRATGALPATATLETLTPKQRRELHVAVGIDVDPEKVQGEQAIERELVETAYAEKVLKGKPHSQMTAAEKVEAQRWNKTRTPDKLTDQERLISLWRSGKPEDKALFYALRPSAMSEDSPDINLMSSILMRAVTSSVDNITGEINPDQFEQVRKLFLPLWPKMPALPDLKKEIPKSGQSWGEWLGGIISAPSAPPAPVAPPAAVAPATPQSTLPKPTPGNTEASDDVMKRYLAAHGNNVEAAAAAMEKDGWK